MQNLDNVDHIVMSSPMRRSDCNLSWTEYWLLSYNYFEYLLNFFFLGPSRWKSKYNNVPPAQPQLQIQTSLLVYWDPDDEQWISNGGKVSRCFRL